LYKWLQILKQRPTGLSQVPIARYATHDTPLGKGVSHFIKGLKALPKCLSMGIEIPGDTLEVAKPLLMAVFIIFYAFP
jgi:hypothetical protein